MIPNAIQFKRQILDSILATSHAQSAKVDSFMAAIHLLAEKNCQNQHFGLSNSDIIAISSALIAISALSVSIWQGIISRKHCRISVRPKLQVICHSMYDSFAGLELQNCGLGPARVDSIEMMYNGTKLDLNTASGMQTLLHLIAKERINNDSESMCLAPKSLIQQNSSLFLLKMQATNQLQIEELAMNAEAVFKKAKIIVNYSSLYNEKFVFDSDKS